MGVYTPWADRGGARRSAYHLVVERARARRVAQLSQESTLVLLRLLARARVLWRATATAAAATKRNARAVGATHRVAEVRRCHFPRRRGRARHRRRALPGPGGRHPLDLLLDVLDQDPLHLRVLRAHLRARMCARVCALVCTGGMHTKGPLWPAAPWWKPCEGSRASAGDLREICGRSVGDLWEICGRSVGDLWEICGRSASMRLRASAKRMRRRLARIRLTHRGLTSSKAPRVSIWKTQNVSVITLAVRRDPLSRSASSPS